jgi:hypothetical protein
MARRLRQCELRGQTGSTPRALSELLDPFDVKSEVGRIRLLQVVGGDRVMP